MSYQITIADHNFSVIQPVTGKVRDLLSIEQRIYRKGLGWKTITHSMTTPDGKFYTGLYPFIMCNIDGAVVARDDRKWPEYSFKIPELSKDLRDYQIEYAVQALQTTRCIVESDTGSGKTIMMAALLAILDLPTLIIVPNKTILYQLSTELTTLIPGSEFGIASGEKVKRSRFLIGLPGTLSKFPSPELREFKVVMMDEAHLAAGQRIEDLILTVNAPFRFGFTGTAKGRSDGRDLVVEGLFGPPIKLIETQQLTDQGYLAPVKIEIVRGWWEGNFAALEDHLIVRNEKRNELITKIVKAQKGTVLVLVKRIEHGEILQKLIPHSIFVSGDTDGEKREEIRQSILHGTYRVLIASNVFAVGLDIPNLEVGINAAGGKAEILTKQRFGRITRPWNEVVKKWIDIYDDYHPGLEEHSKERVKYYRGKSQFINFAGFPPGKQKRLENGWEADNSERDVDLE